MSGFKKILLILGLILLSSCTSANKSEENLKKLDQLYGYCDNPHRSITGKQYEICKAKEDAAGPDGEVGESKSITEIFGSITGNKKTNNPNTIVVSNVNRYLWLSSMDVLSIYSIKNIDSNIGYIETDWIYEKDKPDQRCFIKIQIRSSELISNGVSSAINCQYENSGQWISDGKSYIKENQALTLKILSEAQKLAQQNL